MALSAGAQFQKSLAESCEKQNIFLVRLRDVYIHPELRSQVDLPESPYDYVICHSGIVLPVELKSTKLKYLSFKMIKDHQIAALNREQKYTDVYPGFIFNFREYNNATYYIHIKKFLEYQKIVAEGAANYYQGKINWSSMPLEICKEIGISISSQKLRVHFRYDIQDLIEKIKCQFQKPEVCSP